MTVWSRISSENRSSNRFNKHARSFVLLHIVFIYGIPARRIEVCTEQPGFDTSDRRIEVCTEQPGFDTNARRIEVCTEQPGFDTNARRIDVCTQQPFLDI